MSARRVFALALILSTLAACGLLIGVEKLGVDPSDASAPTIVDGQAPDADGSKPIEDATVLDTTAPDGAPTSRRVFLTSTTTNGLFNGIAGADAACATAATSAKLGGTWVAWISGNGKNAIDRLTFNGPFHLLDTTPVVANKALLTTTGPSHAISVMENGQVASGSPWVWTGTSKNGQASNYRCNDWTTTNPVIYGIVGSFDETTNPGNQTAHWTDNQGPGAGFPGFGCQTSARFYCFEQQ